MEIRGIALRLVRPLGGLRPNGIQPDRGDKMNVSGTLKLFVVIFEVCVAMWLLVGDGQRIDSVFV